MIGTEPDGSFYIASTEGPEKVIAAMEFAKFWLFSNALDEID